MIAQSPHKTHLTKGLEETPQHLNNLTPNPKDYINSDKDDLEPQAKIPTYSWNPLKDIWNAIHPGAPPQEPP